MRMISPDKRIITILKSLCNDKQNMVFIISSFDIKLLQILFKDIDNLGLCGENGFYYKYPSEKEFNTLVMSSLVSLGTSFSSIVVPVISKVSVLRPR